MREEGREGEERDCRCEETGDANEAGTGEITRTEKKRKHREGE